MVMVEGLEIEECIKCSQNPNKCGVSNVYREASDLLRASKLEFDSRGMTSYEIIRYIKANEVE